MKLQKWQYKMAYVRFDTKIRTVATLNELGQEGWELVTVQGDYGIFKRPIREPNSRRFPKFGL